MVPVEVKATVPLLAVNEVTFQSVPTFSVVLVGAERVASGMPVVSESPGLRDQLVLATKGGIRPPVPYDSSPTALRRACEASLRRLDVDVIDLYQVHRPDLFAHPAEVATTLEELRDEGKIREVGLSNVTVAQHDVLDAFLTAPLATTQPEYSAAHLDPLRDGTFDRCLRDGITVLAWSPLAGGRLTGGGGGGGNDGVRPALLAVLDGLAGREGVDRSPIALAFVLAHPVRPVAIVGSQSPERIAAATRATEVHGDRHDCYRIIEASAGAMLP
jgi:aryl-alcohol dehydrogenase-like predicted oxidoreductase